MKYIKKPIPIEAEVYTIGMEDGFMSIGNAITSGLAAKTFTQPECAKFQGVPYIKTLEGCHFISDGDYIITGVQGERYPCKPDIFKQTYDTVEECEGTQKLARPEWANDIRYY